MLTIVGMVLEEFRALFAPRNFLTFSDPIISFAARSYCKLVRIYLHRGKMPMTWLFVHRKQPN